MRASERYRDHLPPAPRLEQIAAERRACARLVLPFALGLLLLVLSA